MSQAVDGSGSNLGHPSPSGPSPSTLFMSLISLYVMSSVNDIQKGFVTSIRMLELDWTMVGPALVRTVGEMFPPVVLFGSYVRAMPALHTELRNFFDSSGVSLTPRSSRRIMMILATNIYKDSEDRTAAENIFRDIIATGRHSPTPPTTATLTTSTTGDGTASSGSVQPTSADKIAQNVSMRFKYLDEKFAGEIGEC